MRTPSDHLRTLQRRVDFLKSRAHKNSYDAAELGSLEWVLLNLPAEQRPCPTCEALARTVMMDQTSHDMATELLQRCENEMRYAGWCKFESDNTARNGVYEQVKHYLEKNT